MFLRGSKADEVHWYRDNRIEFFICGGLLLVLRRRRKTYFQTVKPTIYLPK